MFSFTVRFVKSARNASDVNVHVNDVLQDIRVLVVHGSHKQRAVFANALERLGCRHTEIALGQEALALLHGAAAKGDPFRFVVCNAHLHDMAAETLASGIKAAPSLANVVLILTTDDSLKTPSVLDDNFRAQLVESLDVEKLRNCLFWLLTDAVSKASRRALEDENAFNRQQEQSPHILLVEDNVINRMVALKQLERVGLRADTACNGQEAIAMLGKNHYDIVLMDMQMPVMDGLEATRAIRSGATKALASDIPIIAMTANAFDNDRQECLSAGMNDFIAKPVRAKELHDKIALWVKQPHASDGHA